ncbi:MAG: hypothetical protein PHE67_00525 [Campylobacterales bacterium]|nr:hypothetical protein [Campylobacterales bacterium]
MLKGDICKTPKQYNINVGIVKSVSGAIFTNIKDILSRIGVGRYVPSLIIFPLGSHTTLAYTILYVRPSSINMTLGNLKTFTILAPSSLATK